MSDNNVRIEYAIRALNGGSLPVFDAKGVDKDWKDEIVPFDGTPETALGIIQRKLEQAGQNPNQGIALSVKEADTLIEACPSFYQGWTKWEFL